MMLNQVSIIKKTVIASSVLAIVISSGCATPQYTSQNVDDATLKKAGNEITSANNWVPRYLSDEEAEKKVIEIYGKLLPGATKVCRQLAEDECSWDIRYSPDDSVNAFAAGESVIVIKKGILRHAENDDEIAMVISHEMSHHAANHIEETKKNAVTGAVVGMVLMGALAGAGSRGYASSYQMNNAMDSGMKMGAAVGNLSFSKDQENEADYLAAYFMNKGGFDLKKGRTMWIKLGKLGTTEHGQRHSLNTHPDPAERLARWDKTTIEIITNPAASPVKRAPQPSNNNSGPDFVGGNVSKS